jgi:hypothetical protein
MEKQIIKMDLRELASEGVKYIKFVKDVVQRRICE